MKYLVESVSPEDTSIITEAVDGNKKSMYISGPFLMFEKRNRNGRRYPEKIMEKAVSEYKKEYIDTCRSLGEMNHPAGRLQIDPERACIMITELTKDGCHYMGKAKVLSTPLGKLLEALLNDGVKPGVSSRGYGTLTSDKTVKEDFRLTTAADVVHDPSAQDAYVSAIMEQKEFMLVNGILVEKQFDQLDRIKTLRPSKEYQEAVLAQFKQILGGF